MAKRPSAGPSAGQPKRQVRILSSIAQVSAEQWDHCANSEPRQHNPFLSHRFLLALEQSGCVCAQTGWQPQHLLLENNSGEVLAAMPCYLKSHSYGEYVFDHAWAEAFERAGGDYYPKLQCSVPFTPVTGRRLLLPPNLQDEEQRKRESQLLQGAQALAHEHRVSSLHVTFFPEQQTSLFTQHGFLLRTDQQFHWINPGYEGFDQFLAALSARKRKAIRKEREAIQRSGISFEWCRGSKLTEAHWDAFFAFYQDTGNRKWGSPYLNREFFSLLQQSMADELLLILCRKDNRYIAGALNVIGGDTLYGRYWGCLEQVPFLHFETCYYQAIDYAIQHRLTHVEAGAQGAHKLARGYLPKTTYSAHHIAHPGLRAAIKRYLAQERQEVALETEWLSSHSPFRKSET